MMQIRVTGKQIDIGEALTGRVREKLAVAVEKHFGRDGEANVTIAKEGGGFRADCTVHLSSGTTMQAHGTAEDAYLAFEIALDRLEKQIRRYTRRLKNHHERGSHQVRAPSE